MVVLPYFQADIYECATTRVHGMNDDGRVRGNWSAPYDDEAVKRKKRAKSFSSCVRVCVCACPRLLNAGCVRVCRLSTIYTIHSIIITTINKTAKATAATDNNNAEHTQQLQCACKSARKETAHTYRRDTGPHLCS